MSQFSSVFVSIRCKEFLLGMGKTPMSGYVFGMRKALKCDEVRGLGLMVLAEQMIMI